MNVDKSKVNSRAACSRRNALRSVLAGTAAIGTWKSPVVQSVILPAHAETTVVSSVLACSSVPNFSATGATRLVSNTNGLTPSPFDQLAPAAYAGVGDGAPPGAASTIINASCEGSGATFLVEVFELISNLEQGDVVSTSSSLYIGSVPTSGATVALTRDATSCTPNQSLSINASITSLTTLMMTFDVSGTAIVLSPGSMVVPAASTECI